MDPEPENIEDLRRRLNGRAGHVHCVGIGGVGMAGLAFLLKRRGFTVSGCDAAPGRLTTWLEKEGIPVASGHAPGHLDASVHWVVRSSAVSPDTLEIRNAIERGLPVHRRGEALAVLAETYTTVAVAGTHGKTTTTAMIVRILRQAGCDPSFCIGGESAEWDGVAGAGRGDVLVLEADESDGTLALYRPDIAIVTNIEFDHAEFFPDTAALERCFSTFAQRVKKRLFFCGDDARASAVCSGSEKAMAYGFSESARIRAVHLREKAGGSVFQCQAGSGTMEIPLPAPGRHNALNACAAAAVALELGVSPAAIQRALAGFVPVRRRLESVVDTDELRVFSDYGHHPTEIAATLKGAASFPRKRTLAVFQPHRYSRTRALGGDFSAAFRDVDEVILTPVYAASEAPTPGGTTWDLYERFRKAGGPRALCATSLEQAWEYVRRILKPGDALFVLGAGDVDRIARWAGDALRERGLAFLNPVPPWIDALGELKLDASRFTRNESLTGKTSLRVGGRADIFMNVGSGQDAAIVLQWACRNGVPVTWLGAGSNVLASDLGVRGLVLRLDRRAFGTIEARGGAGLTAGAAVGLNRLVSWTAKSGLTGLECLHGIPGTLGGALRMNAGAWGEAIGSRVDWVRTLNRAGKEQVFQRADLHFTYRQCPELKDALILEAGLTLEPGEPETIRKRLAEIADKRAWLAGLRSAGSVFKNPDGHFAGRLIEAAGLKGRRIGGARVCERHANVIVTEEGATASDVRALMEIVKESIRQQNGIELQEEVVVLE